MSNITDKLFTPFLIFIFIVCIIVIIWAFITQEIFVYDIKEEPEVINNTNIYIIKLCEKDDKCS